MSTAIAGKGPFWKGLLGHFSHGASATMAEQVLGSLLGLVEHDFAELRERVDDLRWAPLRRAEESLRMVAKLRRDTGAASDLTELEIRLLGQALDDFRLSAGAMHDDEKCRARLAGVACARLAGRLDEADALYGIARDDLFATNARLYAEYIRVRNRAKRSAHSYLGGSRVRKVVNAAFLVTVIAATIEFSTPVVICGLLFGAAAGGGTLSNDRAKVAERLRATFLLGTDVFPDLVWREPEDIKPIWERPGEPAGWGVP